MEYVIPDDLGDVQFVFSLYGFYGKQSIALSHITSSLSSSQNTAPHHFAYLSRGDVIYDFTHHR
jgi:hypothetical protein